jgi:hypothetical protein
MGNPLEDTGLLREGRAVNLFNMRDYSAAALVFEDVLEKVVGIERYHYYSGLVRLAKGYGAWDMADYGAALEHLGTARKELSVDFEDPALADRSSALLNRLGENQPFLGRLWRNGQSHLSLEKVVDMVEKQGGGYWIRDATTTAWPGSTARSRCGTSGGCWTVTP